MTSLFRICYINRHAAVQQPETYEGYDLVSAFYDYQPAGPAATIWIGTYSLQADERIFLNWVRQCLPLAEALASGQVNPAGRLRQDLTDLPANAVLYSWIVADAPVDTPILLFASCDGVARIYTRTDAGVPGPRLRIAAWDLPDPVLLPLAAIIGEITAFLTKYLDDLLAAFPFIAADDVYLEHRRRIAALREKLL